MDFPYPWQGGLGSIQQPISWDDFDTSRITELGEDTTGLDFSSTLVGLHSTGQALISMTMTNVSLPARFPQSEHVKTRRT